jgi:GntR family transcriptional regulator, rspAB operon transcriptional repressor
MHPDSPPAPPARSFSQIDRQLPISPQVYAALREAILNLQLAPGAMLSEQTLAAELGVSRTPVREAILRLTREGLVVVYAQSGTVVSKIDLAQVEEARFVRSALECAAIADAGGATEGDVRELQAILARQREFEASKDASAWSQFFALDQELHRKLTQISGHPLVWDVITAARVHMDRVRKLSMPFSERIPEITTIAQVIQEHERIVSAVAAGDLRAAQEAMAFHLSGVTRIAVLLASELPDYFDPAPDPSTAGLAPGLLDREGRT